MIDGPAIEVRGWSLHQPFGSYVMRRLKRKETRPKPHPYRGLVAIHAAKPWNEAAAEHARCVRLAFPELVDDWHPGDMPRGAFLAVANLVACEVMTPQLIEAQTSLELMTGDWRPGRYAYTLEDVRRLPKPIEACGKQGLWRLTSIPSAILATAQAIEWDARHRVGIAVRYWPNRLRTSKPIETTTRSPASVVGDTAVVWLKDYAGCVAMSHVEVIA